MEDENVNIHFSNLKQNISIVKSIFRKMLGNYELKINLEINEKINLILEKNRRKLEPILALEPRFWPMDKIERFLLKHVNIVIYRVLLKIFIKLKVFYGDYFMRVISLIKFLLEIFTIFLDIKK